MISTAARQKAALDRIHSLRTTPMKRLSLLLFAIAGLVRSQSSMATLSGTIVDPSDAAVPSAAVSIVSIETGLERKTVANAEGVFSIALLPPSNYRVTVRHPGFAPAEFERVTLQVGDRVSIRIPMQVGRVEDTVTVLVDASPLQEDGAVGTVIGHQFIENQPLNGRSFQSLAQLSPGVVLTPTNVTASGQFSVNGQRADTTTSPSMASAPISASTARPHSTNPAAGLCPRILHLEARTTWRPSERYKNTVSKLPAMHPNSAGSRERSLP
jgi:hypothetical protein